MNAVRRAITLIAGLSLLAIMLGGVTFLAQNYLPAPLRPQFLNPTPRPLTLAGTAEKMLDLLDANYIHPLDEPKMFASGVKGLRETLKASKLSAEGIPDIPATSKDRKSMLADLTRALEAAKANAGDKLSEQKLLYAALRGMLAGLNDPFCSLFDPAEYKHFDEQMSGGNFGGIGVYMEMDRAHKNRLTVVEPIEGTPAYEAGLKESDVIEKIDGESTAGWDIEKAISRIRGKEGSEVLLGIYRPQPEKHFEVKVKRAKIQARSVSSRLLKDKFGYIRIRIYGEDTDKEFSQELAKMVKKNAKGLIVDVRNNGGGYITAAIDICSHFIDKGKTVVSVVNSRTGRNDSYPSSGAEPSRLPMVLLVNRFSASASEITAGALRDHKAALLVGEKTFGKASVQQLEKLSDGGALKYTVAHYLTPKGRDIHKQGIGVDIEVKVSEDDKTDKALERAEFELQTLIDAHPHPSPSP